MHNGFLNVEGEKMSKSLGNFFTVRDLLDKGFPGEVIRFVLLSHALPPADGLDRGEGGGGATCRRSATSCCVTSKRVGMLPVADAASGAG